MIQYSTCPTLVLVWNNRPTSQVDYDWVIELSLPVRSSVTILLLISCSNIGQQLNVLDQELRDKGATQLVFIGSDAPELMTKDYLNTIDALRYFDTILKPVKNAGIALIASKKTWPDLSILPWGTDKLGKTLVTACHNEKQSVITLDSTCNIDELDGFVKLIMLLKKTTVRFAVHCIN